MPTESNKWCNDSSLYFQKEDASRIFTLHKEIAENISSFNPIEILDFGCGNGKILESFPTISKYKFTLYDPEQNAINEAIKKFSIYRNIHYELDSKKLPKNYYDVVIFCNVIMVIQTKEELEKTIQILKRVKKLGGVLYVGLTHPCFLDRQFSTYENDFTLKNQSFNYFSNGDKYKVYMKQEDKTIVIKDFFWNLSVILNLFLTNGFTLQEIKELKDIENNNFSPFLILKLK